MYKYLKGVIRREHMVYASELAKAYKIYTIKRTANDSVGVKSPHSRLVTEILKDYAENYGIEVEELYYQTSKGLARVYPQELYVPAIKEFIEKTSIANESLKTYTSNKGTKYQFTLGG